MIPQGTASRPAPSFLPEPDLRGESIPVEAKIVGICPDERPHVDGLWHRGVVVAFELLQVVFANPGGLFCVLQRHAPLASRVLQEVTYTGSLGLRRVAFVYLSQLQPPERYGVLTRVRPADSSLLLPPVYEREHGFEAGVGSGGSARIAGAYDQQLTLHADIYPRTGSGPYHRGDAAAHHHVGAQVQRRFFESVWLECDHLEVGTESAEGIGEGLTVRARFVSKQETHTYSSGRFGRRCSAGARDSVANMRFLPRRFALYMASSAASRRVAGSVE